MSETRRQIRAHVHANAGIHFNELVRQSAFAPGQIQYHVRRLIEDDRLVRRELYGRTHYYPPTTDEWEQTALALFRRETARGVVRFLLERGPTGPASAADALNVARSTLEYHLDRLVECDVVEKRYDDRNRVTISLADPELTATVLATVEPTPPDRLVDRFTRLVDDLFEDDPRP